MSTENLPGNVHQIHFLKYYIGSLVHCIGKGYFILVGINFSNNTFGIKRSATQVEWLSISPETVRLKVRPIARMYITEVHHIAWLALNSMSEQPQIEKDEVQVVGDISSDDKFPVIAFVKANWFDGVIKIDHKGNVVLEDNTNGIRPNGNQAFITTYLLGAEFDIFGTLLS